MSGVHHCDREPGVELAVHNEVCCCVHSGFINTERIHCACRCMYQLKKCHAVNYFPRSVVTYSKVIHLYIYANSQWKNLFESK